MNLRAIEQAFRACPKRKRATVRDCLYETQLLDNLIDTRDALQRGCWQPVPPVVFCVEQPKAREVCAAQFQDRIVHHLLVPWLEQLLDGHFIYDAASNRKGTHFAVNRLQEFMRSRQGKGWFLQLDIASFFNSIHQGILLEILSNKLRCVVAVSHSSKRDWLTGLGGVLLPSVWQSRSFILATPASLSASPPTQAISEFTSWCGVAHSQPDQSVFRLFVHKRAGPVCKASLDQPASATSYQLKAAWGCLYARG